jgi:ribose 5-phosphate isomerase B
MKVSIACDHGAYDFKPALVEFLESRGIEVSDCGTDSKESCDYPDYAEKALDLLVNNKVDRAILTCTNGIGMSMVANKTQGVRAALAYSVKTAETTRRHHDSNTLCLGTDEFNEEQLLSFVAAWLDSDFEGGRHLRRISKFPREEE